MSASATRARNQPDPRVGLPQTQRPRLINGAEHQAHGRQVPGTVICQSASAWISFKSEPQTEANPLQNSPALLWEPRTVHWATEMQKVIRKGLTVAFV